MNLRRAAKSDANSTLIVKALRQAGVLVVYVGFPFDALLGFRGRWVAVELKNGSLSPSRRKLRASQEKFFAEAAMVNCPTFKVETIAEAYAALGIKTIASNSSTV